MKSPWCFECISSGHRDVRDSLKKDVIFELRVKGGASYAGESSRPPGGMRLAPRGWEDGVRW